MSDEDERDDEREDDQAGEGADEQAAGEGDRDESDESSDDGGADDTGSEEPASGAAAPATPVKSKASKAQRTSAGARLAAAKAAKAAAKAAAKQARREEAGAAQSAAEREAEDLAQAQSAEDLLKESPLGRAATRAGEWTSAHRQLAMGVGAIVLVLGLGWAGWTYYTTSQARAAGALLADALRISGAEIVSADDTAEHDDADDDDAPTFESIEARNEAALAAYRRVSHDYPSSQAAAWARLGEGRALLAQGEYADARTAYQAAFDASGDEYTVAWQALEGVGATYEAESNWAEATSAYERLASLNDHAFENVANYHLARMHAAQGDESAALTSFRELVESLREEGDQGEPPFPYVLAQADQRLRELDPSAAGAGPSLGGGGGGGAPSGLEGMSPEQIQELIRRLQSQSAGGAGGGGGGEPQPE